MILGFKPRRGSPERQVDETAENVARGGRTPVPEEGGSGTPEPLPGSLGSEPWLVLGGGGLKGLAHIGAIRAVVEAEVRIGGIVGTSIGALIGAIWSAGTGWREMREAARALRKEDIIRVNRRAVLFNGIRQPSVFRGDTLREYLERLLPEGGWSALRVPLLVNAVDLATGRTEWFGPGARTDLPLVDVVYASSALPVFYPPLVEGGRAYVDGGAEHPIGVARARAAGASGLIAVDVGSGETGDAETILAKGMLAVHQRIFAIMTYRRRREAVDGWAGPPLVYVRPRLEGYGTFDFGHVEYFVEEGYRATREALGRGNASPPPT